MAEPSSGAVVESKVASVVVGTVTETEVVTFCGLQSQRRGSVSHGQTLPSLAQLAQYESVVAQEPLGSDDCGLATQALSDPAVAVVEAVVEESAVAVVEAVVVVVVDKGAVVTTAPLHLGPLPLHFSGKKKRTSSVSVSRSLSAKISLPSTVGCVKSL